MLYQYIIFPLEKFFEVVFSFLNNVTGSYLAAIVLLSLVIRVITIPLEQVVKKGAVRENELAEVLAPQLSEIKKNYIGAERHAAIGRLYKRYSYHPIMALRTLGSLFVQLPFFIAVYYMMSIYPPLKSASVPLIGNLATPDSLLGDGVNVLPVIMFIISVIAALTMPNITKRECRQSIVLSLMFLLILYNSPACLVIYWTVNGVYSLLTNFVHLGEVKKIIWQKMEFSFLPFACCIVAFIIVPLHMIGSSPEEFAFLKLSPFLTTALFHSAVLFSVLCLIRFSLNKLGKKWHGSTFLYVTFFWVVLAGLYFPVVKSSGMVDIQKMSTDWVNVIFLIFLTSLLSWVMFTRYKIAVYLFVGIALITTVGVSFSRLANAPVYKIFTKTDRENNGLKLSTQKNILVISFDGLQSSLLKRLIDSDQNIAKSFKDFQMFTNAVSQSPATRASLMGELFGVRQYKKWGNTPPEIEQAVLRTNIAKSLLTSRFTDVYHYGYPILNAKPFLNDYSSEDNFATSDFSFYSIARVCSSVVTASYRKLFDSTIKCWAYGNRSAFEQKIKNHKGAKWDLNFIRDIKVYDYFVSNLTAVEKDISIRRVHFLFTHFPIDFDEHGNYRSDDYAWHKANQNEDGLANEQRFAVVEFLRLLKKLKQLGVYDNSMIIFKSDHGMPVKYFNSYPLNLRINGHDTYGYSRYQPVLMIKDFQAKQDGIKYNSNVVLLNDLARTLCEQTDGGELCNNFPGLNLLSAEKSKLEPYYLYMAPDYRAAFRFETHKEYLIDSREKKLLDALIDHPQVSLTN